MLDNSDLNNLIREAMEAKPFNLVIEELRKYLSTVVKPLDETRYSESTFFDGTCDHTTIAVRSNHIGFTRRELYSPYKCIGVPTYQYRYYISPQVAANVAAQYILASEPLLKLEGISFDRVTVSCLAEELEIFLNKQKNISPYDKERLARLMVSACGESFMLKRMLKETAHHPRNLKITFFKKVISLLSSVINKLTRKG